MIAVRQLAIVAILTISGVCSTNTLRSAAVSSSDCIMVMGGWTNALKSVCSEDAIEYYHPENGVECNRSHIPPIKNLAEDQCPAFTSGCYLFDSQQVVVRESSGYSQSSMIYGLENGVVKAFPRAHISQNSASASASVDLARCLSCGGSSGSECYEFNKSTKAKWAQIPSLPEVGVRLAASASLGHFYYVIGGINTTKLFRYDTRNGTWEGKKSMHLTRFGHSAAPLSDHEFITCGRSNFTTDCEIYNATNDEWQMGSRLTTNRVYFQMVNFKGKVYAIGGGTSSDGAWFVPLSTVEVYDRANRSWSMVGKSLKVARYVFLAFAITLPERLTAVPPPTTPPSAPQTTKDEMTITTTQPLLRPPTDTTTAPPTPTTAEGTTEKMPISTLLWVLIGVGILLAVIMIPIAITGVLMIVLRCRKRRRHKDDGHSERDEVVLPSSTKGNPNWPRLKKNADGSYTEETESSHINTTVSEETDNKQ